jgi:hypothetical protein
MSEVVPMRKKSVPVAGQAEVDVNLGPPVLLEGEDLAQLRAPARPSHRRTVAADDLDTAGARARHARPGYP